MRLMRVRRIVEYLGTPEAVQTQLDSSLKEGRHNLLRDTVAISIAQLGPPEFVNGETPTKEAAFSHTAGQQKDATLPPMMQPGDGPAPLCYVTREGRVRLPDDVRDALGLREGGGIVFDVDAQTRDVRMLTNAQFLDRIEPKKV